MQPAAPKEVAMRLRPDRHQRQASRTLAGDGNRRRQVDPRFDLSSITFTEDEILADLLYPGRAPGSGRRGR
jgi:hypothetical protein